MKQHLIFIDIDGTLIHDDQTISPATINVLTQLQQQGHIVYIATGRMRLHAEGVRNLINQDVKLINSNGAMYDLGDQIGIEYLGVIAVKKVIEVVTKNNVSVRLFTANHVYHNVSDKHLLSVKTFAAKILRQGQISYFKNVGEIDAKQITNGLIAGTTPEKLAIVRKELQQIHDIDISSSDPSNIELLPKGVNKATAVKHVQTYYQIPASQTVVFGNGENDISMLEAGDVSVAMGNSQPNVFKHAKYVTETNEDDGVAKFLTTYFELK